MTLPIEEVKKIHTKYKEVATHRFAGGRGYDPDHLDDGIVHTTGFYTSDDDGPFPDTFEMLVLSAPPTPEGSWSLGETYGIAVDESASEVAYWAVE